MVEQSVVRVPGKTVIRGKVDGYSRENARQLRLCFAVW